MRVLVLTGPPAVGKSTVAPIVAAHVPRCAVVEVDDIRRLVLSGAAAPWDGRDGVRQLRLGVLNACALARNFASQEIDVVIVDVLNQKTAALYRRRLDKPLIVQLGVSPGEARRRALSRPIHITWDEFEMLHRQQAALTAADLRLDTTALSATETAVWLAHVWTVEPDRPHGREGVSA
jgi:hypothetical protein